MSKFYTNIYQRGDKLYVRGYENGKLVEKIENYKPYLFVQKKGGKYKSLEGNDLDKIEFNSISEAKEFIKLYDDVSGFEIYGLTDFKYLYAQDEYQGEIKYDTSLISVGSIDIECKVDDQGFPDIKKADREITAITIRKNNKSFVFSCVEYTAHNESVYYIKCKNEVELLTRFIDSWMHLKFDVITGWNIEFFDIPYLINRIIKVLGRREAEKLSPWKILEERIIEIRGKENQTYNIVGIANLDYFQLYRKFKFGNKESYKLSFIAQDEEVGDKITYEGTLDSLYYNNPQKYIEYNIHDAVLVDKLNDKLGFIELVFAFAYDAKVNYSDTMTTVKPWDVIIHNDLMKHNICIPQFKRQNMFDSLVGGYVKEPKIGLSKWVVSFDLTSLYPHLITGYNISPETFVKRIPNFISIDEILNGNYKNESEYSIAANGCVYRKDKQGFLPRLMEKMYNDRSIYKTKMIEAKKKYEETKDPELIKEISRYHNLQLAKKIQLNSAYGALANLYFRWFNFNHAEAITLSGQLAIRWIEKKINEYMNKLMKTKNIDYVVASDTDSIYVTMETLVSNLGNIEEKKIVKIVNEFCESKIQTYINKCYIELSETMNMYKQSMHMKRETICFPGQTNIETIDGPKQICKIKIGDYVLTHKGRYQKVVKCFKSNHTGIFTRIQYTSHKAANIRGTPNHPILVERNNIQEWIAFDEVNVGDIIFVKGKKCPKTNLTIPYWQNRHNTWNAAADDPLVRQKLIKGKSKEIRSKRSGIHKHMDNDILPFCEQKTKEGWKMIPIGSNVIPDAIGIKDNKIVAFEIEKSGGSVLEYKKAKYNNSIISNYVDEICWIDIKPERKQNRSIWYEEADNGFVKIKVTNVYTDIIKRPHNQNKISVYNLEVEEDNSYVAKGVVVHNCNKGIWKAKKMYILNAWDVEGVTYDKPKLKIQGIEAIRSSTPQACRKAIKESLSIIMNGNQDDLRTYVNKFREEFSKLSFEEVASPRGINGMTKYYDSQTIYKKGTPLQVKGALLFNSLLKKHNIKNIPPIQDGDKVKYAYLKIPNPIHDTVISTSDIVPPEFNLDKYIDRDLQFSKTFLEPLKSITEVIGWNPENVSTLEGFFG